LIRYLTRIESVNIFLKESVGGNFELIGAAHDVSYGKLLKQLFWDVILGWDEKTGYKLTERGIRLKDKFFDCKSIEDYEELYYMCTNKGSFIDKVSLLYKNKLLSPNYHEGCDAI